MTQRNIKELKRKYLWQEDDAFPIGAESLSAAFKRIFGCDLPPRDERKFYYDCGDVYFSLMEIDGKIIEVCFSFPGNSSIAELI